MEIPFSEMSRDLTTLFRRVFAPILRRRNKMRKLIAAMNMTLDGFCDNTAGIPDEEMHEHYSELLKGGDAILYGRKTYQLMQFWQTLLENPSGEKAMDDFAVSMNNIPKIVFSRTLQQLDWPTARLATKDLSEEVVELKQTQGKHNIIFVGSPSLIIALANLNLIDEYQFGIQPIILGSGLPLFKNIKERIDLKLLGTKTFNSGVVIHSYEPIKKVHN
jgi:dihydrofolate reductase